MKTRDTYDDPPRGYNVSYPHHPDRGGLDVMQKFMAAYAWFMVFVAGGLAFSELLP